MKHSNKSEVHVLPDEQNVCSSRRLFSRHADNQATVSNLEEPNLHRQTWSASYNLLFLEATLLTVIT